MTRAKQRHLLSLLLVFKDSLAARNFQEHHNNSTPIDCVEPLFLQIIDQVYVGVIQSPSEISEKQESKAPSTQSLIKLPSCIRCLLLLDENFSGIETAGGDWLEQCWPEVRKMCPTCKALDSIMLKCTRCESVDDLW